MGPTGKSPDHTQAGGRHEWEGEDVEEGPEFLPFVVTELVAVVIRRTMSISRMYLVLGFMPVTFTFAAGEHPPGGKPGGEAGRDRAPEGQHSAGEISAPVGAS